MHGCCCCRVILKGHYPTPSAWVPFVRPSLWKPGFTFFYPLHLPPHKPLEHRHVFLVSTMMGGSWVRVKVNLLEPSVFTLISQYSSLLGASPSVFWEHLLCVLTCSGSFSVCWPWSSVFPLAAALHSILADRQEHDFSWADSLILTPWQASAFLLSCCASPVC